VANKHEQQIVVETQIRLLPETDSRDSMLQTVAELLAGLANDAEPYFKWCMTPLTQKTGSGPEYTELLVVASNQEYLLGINDSKVWTVFARFGTEESPAAEQVRIVTARTEQSLPFNKLLELVGRTSFSVADLLNGYGTLRAKMAAADRQLAKTGRQVQETVTKLDLDASRSLLDTRLSELPVGKFVEDKVHKPLLEGLKELYRRLRKCHEPGWIEAQRDVNGTEQLVYVLCTNETTGQRLVLTEAAEELLVVPADAYAQHWALHNSNASMLFHPGLSHTNAFTHFTLRQLVDGLSTWKQRVRDLESAVAGTQL